MEATLYKCDFCKVSQRAYADPTPGYIPMGWRVLASKQQDQANRYEPTEGVRSYMCELCYAQTRVFWDSLVPQNEKPKRRKFDLNAD